MLLSFLSLFPEGILLEDFVQFVEMPGMMQHVPPNWISPLIKLSLLSSESDFKEKFETLDSEVAKQLMKGTSKSSIVKMFLEYRSEKHNNILCLRNITVGKQTELIIVVNYMVREVISESAKETNHLNLVNAGLWNALVFHRLHLNSLLHYARTNLNLIDDMFDGTQMSYNLFQMIDSTEIEDYKTHELKVPLFEVPNKGKASLKAMFTHYQTSYNLLLTDSHFLNALDGVSYFLLSHEKNSQRFEEGEAEAEEDEEEISAYMNILEDTIMKIITLCKVFDENEILVVIEKTAVKLRDIALGLDSSFTFQWLPFKVVYCMASLNFQKVLDSPLSSLQNAADLLVAQIDDMEYKLRDVKPAKTDEEMIKYCQCQINILKYYFINCEKVKKSNIKLHEYSGTKEELEKLVVEVFNLIQSNDELNYLWIVWAKSCLALFEHTKEVAIMANNFTIVDLSSELLKGFEIYKAYGCLLKTFFCLALSSSEEITLKAKLDYIKEGLKLAEEKNQESMRKAFLEERKKLLEEIEKANAHKITYLQARPIRNRNSQGSHSQIKADVRNILMNLPSDQVQIELNCEIFTEMAYRELHKIANGCKLLILDLAEEEEDALVTEDEDLTCRLLTKNQAELIRSLKEDGASAEIVFLMNPTGEKQARQVLEFLKELHVKLMVFFKGPDENKLRHHHHDKLDISHQYYAEQLKKIFLEKFMSMSRKKVSVTRDVRSLIHECTSLAIDQVNHMVRKKAQLYIFDEKHDCFVSKNLPELKFTGDSIGVIEPNDEPGVAGLPLTCYFGVESKAGIVDSSVKNWNNLGSEIIYANRHKEILEIFDLLKRPSTSFVQIYGVEGVGKSFLIKQFDHEIGKRKLFEHGVHYLDCANTAFNPQLRQLIKEAIGMQIMDLGLWFRQNNDCLVILDNFHMAVNNPDVVIPSDLFEEMAAAGVKTIFVMDQEEDMCLEFAHSGLEIYSVEPLSASDCLEIIVTFGACLEDEEEKKMFFALGEKGREKFTKLESFQKVVGYPEQLTHSIFDILSEALNKEGDPLTFRPSSRQSTLNESILSPSYPLQRRQISSQLTGEMQDGSGRHIVHRSEFLGFKMDVMPTRSEAIPGSFSDFDVFQRGCDCYTCKHCNRVIHR